jgi:heme-degrading monooxygenase HmoA
LHFCNRAARHLSLPTTERPLHDDRRKNKPTDDNRSPFMRYAQIFRYTLALNQHEYRQRFVDPYAQGIADFPGLVRKTWMANFDTNEFASVYIWESQEAMERFMASPAIAKVASEPFLKDLVITALPIVEAASHITRGT